MNQQIKKEPEPMSTPEQKCGRCGHEFAEHDGQGTICLYGRYAPTCDCLAFAPSPSSNHAAVKPRPCRAEVFGGNSPTCDQPPDSPVHTRESHRFYHPYSASQPERSEAPMRKDWPGEWCKRCNRRNCVGFGVTDEVWSRVTQGRWDVLCTTCFDEVAQERGVLMISCGGAIGYQVCGLEKDDPAHDERTNRPPGPAALPSLRNHPYVPQREAPAADEHTPEKLAFQAAVNALRLETSESVVLDVSIKGFAFAGSEFRLGAASRDAEIERQRQWLGGVFCEECLEHLAAGGSFELGGDGPECVHELAEKYETHRETVASLKQRIADLETRERKWTKLVRLMGERRSSPHDNECFSLPQNSGKPSAGCVCAVGERLRQIDALHAELEAERG
jgi:hypothetical protein